MSKARLPLVIGVAAAAFVYRRFLGPWHQRWGATDEEVDATLPGDDLILDPAERVTRAISIDAPPYAVWPWLIQIGAERGGFYSYDWLEDLFGLGIHSAAEIVPEWQERSVGDRVYASARGWGFWYVMEVQPDRALVLQTADPKKGRPASCAEGAPMEFTWAFVLREASDGTTRFLVRERVAFGNRLFRLLMAPVGPVSFVMTRKTMRVIKERAESLMRSAPDSVEAEAG